MDFVDNVSEAEQRNNITIVKNYDSATIEAMNAAAKEINERAIKSYKKCGFTVEGVLKNEIFKDGKYYDEIIMSIFKD